MFRFLRSLFDSPKHVNSELYRRVADVFVNTQAMGDWLEDHDKLAAEAIRLLETDPFDRDEVWERLAKALVSLHREKKQDAERPTGPFTVEVAGIVHGFQVIGHRVDPLGPPSSISFPPGMIPVIGKQYRAWETRLGFYVIRDQENQAITS